MKKYKLFNILLFLVATSFNGLSQKKNKWELPTQCLYIDLPSLMNKSSLALPFKKLVILDNRFDTSKLGYIYESKWEKYYKLCFKKDFTNEATSLFNIYYSSNFSQTDDMVFAFVKNISNRMSIPERNPTIREKKTMEYLFYIKVEFYLKKEEVYYPLYRYDSTLTYNWKTEKELGEQISTALITSTLKLQNPAIYKTDKMKSLTYEQIDSFNNLSRNIPLLKQEAAQRGIYLTFNQLKENKPSYTNFKISLSEATDLLYVKGKNLEDSVIADAWGFSDGKNMFIRIGYNFFPLYRKGNNFEFYAHPGISTNKPFPFSSNTPSSSITSGSGMAGAAVELGVKGLLSLINTTTKDLQPYLLDMEAGKIYQSFAIF